MVLTKSSQASLCHEIPIELLPQSNQDAIQITRSLGIRYLWIDALCILQDLDDPSDWLKESARMGDVYKFAYVTISASRASTGGEGCFAEHQPLEARFATSRSLTKMSTQHKQIQSKSQIELKDVNPVTFVDDPAMADSSETDEVLPENEEPQTLKELRWQELQGQSGNQIEPLETSVLSMLTSEEVILEMLIRQEHLLHPTSTLLRTLHEELIQIQSSREQAAKNSETQNGSNSAQGSKAENFSKGIVPHESTNLSVYSKDIGMKILMRINVADPKESLILHTLRRSFFEVEQWRKSNFTLKGPVVNSNLFPRDSVLAKFTPLHDKSLLSIEERRQEKNLRLKIAQNPTKSSLLEQYNQIWEKQRERASLRDANESDIVIKTLQTDLWATEVDASPLSRRAWTLQERLLSTRVLHFTQSQLFWECECSKACETWPQPEFKRTSATESRTTNPFENQEKRQLDGAKLTPLEKHWEEIVELYTDANLTREEDKLVAISSLANTIRQKTKDQYYAGLWRKDFVRNLLFCVELPQKPVTVKYRAPSSTLR